MPRNVPVGAENRPGQSGSHLVSESATERGIAAMAALAVVVMIGSSGSLVPLLTRPEIGGRSGAFLVMAAQASSLGLMLRRHQTAIIAVSALLLAAGSVRLGGTPLGQFDWSPGTWATPMVIMALAVPQFPRRWISLALIMATVGLLEAWSVAELGRPWRLALLQWLFVIHPVVTLALFVDALRSLARKQDLAVRQLRATQLRQEAAEAESTASREAARLVHDHVLQALSAMACGGVAVSYLRTLAATELAALSHRRPAPVVDSLASRLSGLPSGPVPVQVVGDCRGMPGIVADEVTAAVRELVANAQRHSEASRCWVELRNTPDGRHRVRVRDDGHGFDPAAPTSGLGLRHSVRQRLTELGGSARLITTPGDGTEVLLEWPVKPQWNRPSAIGVPPRERSQLVLSAVPGLVATLITAALMAEQTTAPMLGLSTTVPAIVLALLLAKRAARRPTAAQHLGLLAIALAAWGVNLCIVPTTSVDGYLLWMSGGLAAMAQVVLLTSSLRRGFAVAVLMVLIVPSSMVARFGMASTTGPLVGAVVAVLNIAVCGFAALAVAHVLTQQRARREDQQRQAVRAEGLAASRAGIRAWWSQHSLAPSLALLHDVAAGRVDPATPETRAQAGSLAATLRDEMRFGPSAATLCAIAGSARADGWSVRLALPEQLDAASSASAAELVSALGSPPITGQQVTISHDPASGSVQAVVVAASPEQVDSWRGKGLRVQADGDLARLGSRS